MILTQSVEQFKEGTNWALELLSGEWGVSKGLILLIATGVFLWYLSRRNR